MTDCLPEIISFSEDFGELEDWGGGGRQQSIKGRGGARKLTAN